MVKVGFIFKIEKLNDVGHLHISGKQKLLGFFNPDSLAVAQKAHAGLLLDDSSKVVRIVVEQGGKLFSGDSAVPL